MDVPLNCINTAAIEYHVPAKLVLSVLQVERSRSGQRIKNKNGTYDIGAMGINSLWLPELKKHGISEQTILWDACENVKVGTWILSKKIAKRDQLLVGIGDYHSHSNSLNKSYSKKIKISYTKITSLLAESG
jgi:hypothetical protein